MALKCELKSSVHFNESTDIAYNLFGTRKYDTI